MSMIPRVLVLVVALLGCNASPEQPSREVPSRPVPPSAAAPLSAVMPAPSAPLATAGAIASGAAGASGAALGGDAAGDSVGTWEGHYDARKGTVTLPAKVKDKALAADDGKAASGRGSIELVILANGDVRGKASGPLGAAAITGKLDGAMLRAAVRPDDPLAPEAMTGVFFGPRKGETFACEMHVAGPDGTVIRESTVELTRKK